MDRLTVMEQFVCVAETGSFSAAARKLGIGQPAVSKAMAQLEEYLNVTLFVRSTRALSLTDEGEQFRANAQEVIEAAERTEAEARGTAQASEGTVRLSAPEAIVSAMLLPNLSQLRAEHPGLVCEFRESGSISSMVAGGTDIAIHLGPLEDSALLASRCGRLDIIFAASPGYIDDIGEPDHPQSLLGQRRVARLHDPSDSAWHFRSGTSARSIAVSPATGVTNDLAAVEAACRDFGVVRLPILFASDALERGLLKRLLTDYEQQPVDVYILFPAGRRKSARVRAVEVWVRSLFETVAGSR